MEIKTDISVISEFTGYIDKQIYEVSDGSSGKPKWLSATYNFLPLEIKIKERTENE